MPESDKTREELINEARELNDIVFDMDGQKKVHHNWIDRGLKLSCEGAGHPQHEVFKLRRFPTASKT